MSAYHTRASVVADIPAEFLLEALDDDRDGEEDAGLYDAIADNAGESVDAYLGGRFTVPFAEPVPALAKSASRIFCLESLYSRRGFSEKTDPPNPWAGRANEIRARLKRIAAGEDQLRPDPEIVAGAAGTTDAVTEPSRTTSSSGRMAY